MSPGMAYGELGPTHHSIEDLAWLRAIADLTSIVPADPVETAQAVAGRPRAPRAPTFIRVEPDARPGRPRSDDYQFRIGRAARLREGGDVTLIANGVMVSGRWRRPSMLAAARASRRAC